MERQQAKDIAVKICYRLHPYCNKINIAGSIRRQNPHVKDIELVVAPKFTETYQEGLFGTKGKVLRIVDEGFIKEVNSLGKIIKGKPTGKKMQIELAEIMLDLFMPDDFDYYRQYAIRTGSSEYSARVIAAGWKNLGWCGSDHGLRKQSDCRGTKGPDGKIKWKCINENAEKPPVWDSEKSFFDWIGARFVHPMYRS